MRKKKGGGGEDCGSWMDTYGDMVTLLLCFFVLLYSMSTLDNEKFKIFVRSINPNVSEEQIGINQDEGEYGVEDEIRLDPDDPVVDEVELLNMLYEELAEALNEAGVEGVTVTGGEGYTYVAFQGKTFFGGNSSILTEQGQQVLGVFCDVVAPLTSQISQINIMAHTAQADPEEENTPRGDRVLSAMRAAEVCVFIQNREIIDPEKLVDISYGQFRPVADNNTSEGRAQNRRVELLIIEEGADARSLNEYYEEYMSGANADRTIVTDGMPKAGEEGFVTPQGGEEMPENDASMQPPLLPAEGEGALDNPEEAPPAGAADNPGEAPQGDAAE
ncbi:MAG: flagellar motor protein MotB [Lachnospiraceae bacterium]|nr:flagellar motor protein MotB [Lachnospiraceae bacterium]